MESSVMIQMFHMSPVEYEIYSVLSIWNRSINAIELSIWFYLTLINLNLNLGNYWSW